MVHLMLLSMRAPKVERQSLKETHLSNHHVRVGTVDG